MMKYLSLPDPHATRILPFYLAMEEYAARIIGEDDIFFMWQVEPTVIFGRNQLIDSEVNVDYCREHGIAFYRRRSGGGCVYADRDNIMFSYITRSDEVQTTFSAYTTAVAAMLRGLGLNATASNRNDVLIEGRKVSGNAFYHIPGRSIVHGTMLFDTDMEHMLHAITPSRDKLTSKGVQSVRSRITTLSETERSASTKTMWHKSSSSPCPIWSRRSCGATTLAVRWSVVAASMVLAASM